MEYLNGIEKIQKGVSGIYKITNLINEKCYIGQSKNILHRVKYHHLCSYNNENAEQYNFQIYQAIRKYGIENFTIEVIEECPVKMLDERETHWIKVCNSMQNGYNATSGGKSAEQLYSVEARKKSIKTQKEKTLLRGENHPMAKLTNKQVIDIRKRYIAGESLASIYSYYKNTGIAFSSFEGVIHGKSYKYIETIPNDEVLIQTAKRRPCGLLTEETVTLIRKEFRENNCTYGVLAKKYGLDKTTIRLIVIEKTYRNFGRLLTKEELDVYRNNRHIGRIPEETIKSIRNDYINTNYNCKMLAQKYNINQSSVSDIVCGKTYTWVDGCNEEYLQKAAKKKQDIIIGKIPEEIVVAIRKEHRNTLCTYEYLAEKYGLNSGALVSDIVLGKIYRYYEGIPSEEEIKLFKDVHSQKRVSDNDVISIRKKYDETKCSYASLANEYGISRKAVEKIIKRTSHRDVA